MRACVFVLLCCCCFVRHARSQSGVSCGCVRKDMCYQSLYYDGAGVLDVRIVSPGDTTPSNVGTGPPPTSAPGVCPTGWDYCCTGPNVQGCGLRWNIPPSPNVTAVYGSQPWQAVLYVDNVAVGGGALIDQSIVLTAAHKVFGKQASSIKVVLGEFDLNSTVEPFPTQSSAVSGLTVHPSFNPNNLFNDIAVLRLATPINLDVSPAIDTICQPSASANFDNLRCLVSGFGKDSFTGSLQRFARQAIVPVVPYADCQTKLRNTKLTPYFSLDQTSFLCAGGEPGQDACTGDGGFALSCIIGGRYYLAGLVSWGIGCGDTNIPGVYVRIASYIPWIYNVTKS